jgi:integrase
LNRYDLHKTLAVNRFKYNLESGTDQKMSTKLTKSVQEVSKGRSAFGKNDMRYWEGKVYKLSFKEGGKRCESKQYSVKIQYRGQRRNFPLGLSNRSDAARRARDIYHSLIACGWEETIKKFHPQCGKPGNAFTVGDYIDFASRVAGVAPRTIACYASSLRMIAAEVEGIKAAASRFDYKKGGRDAWVAKVDAIPLMSLTPTAIEQWKNRFVRKRKGNPVEERKARNSANSFIRQARSLFAPKIIKHLSTDIELPDPLPFHEVTLFPRTSMRYVSRIDIHKIVSDAREQLGGPRRDDEDVKAYASRIEQFKIFLLAAFGGLRRNEIDKLLWEQVDLDQGIIEIRETTHFKPKSEDSRGQIEIEPEVAAQLERLKKNSRDAFVIRASAGSKKSKSAQWYRAQRHFDNLLVWLRSKGVTDLKPLHMLRKEAGSLVCGALGLHAASRFLRHADVRVTAEHYLDTKAKVTVGMGSLLGTVQPPEEMKEST